MKTFKWFSIVSRIESFFFSSKNRRIFLLLLVARRLTSSFDVILFGLVSKKDIPTNLDLINEFFRLLRPNGYLLTHIENNKQNQVIDHFKMCGFTSCNPLDANSSFLIENKDDQVKKLGSLWLCQKPSFDIGYSVPLRTVDDGRTRQVASSTTGAKKTWTVDDDDLIDTDELLDDNDRKKPDVKSNDEMKNKRKTFQRLVVSFRIRLWNINEWSSKSL